MLKLNLIDQFKSIGTGTLVSIPFIHGIRATCLSLLLVSACSLDKSTDTTAEQRAALTLDAPPCLNQQPIDGWCFPHDVPDHTKPIGFAAKLELQEVAGEPIARVEFRMSPPSYESAVGDTAWVSIDLRNCAEGSTDVTRCGLQENVLSSWCMPRPGDNRTEPYPSCIRARSANEPILFDPNNPATWPYAYSTAVYIDPRRATNFVAQFTGKSAFLGADRIANLGYRFTPKPLDAHLIHHVQSPHVTAVDGVSTEAFYVHSTLSLENTSDALYESVGFEVELEVNSEVQTIRDLRPTSVEVQIGDTWYAIHEGAAASNAFHYDHGTLFDRARVVLPIRARYDHPCVQSPPVAAQVALTARVTRAWTDESGHASTVTVAGSEITQSVGAEALLVCKPYKVFLPHVSSASIDVR